MQLVAIQIADKVRIEVAKTAIDGLASGKRVIIPGLPNRIASVINHHFPRRLLLPMVARNHPGMKQT